MSSLSDRDMPAAHLAYAARECSYQSIRLDDEAERAGADDAAPRWDAVEYTQAPREPSRIELEHAWIALTAKARNSWRRYARAIGMRVADA